MKQVNLLDAKTHLSRLIAEVEEHRKDEIIIARNGHPVARLRAMDSPEAESARRRIGAARELISDSSNEIWVSAASVWEISIKHSLGREAMPVSGHEALHWFSLSGYRDLAITSRHTAAVDSLPLRHNDPFCGILTPRERWEIYRRYRTG